MKETRGIGIKLPKYNFKQIIKIIHMSLLYWHARGVWEGGILANIWYTISTAWVTYEDLRHSFPITHHLVRLSPPPPPHSFLSLPNWTACHLQCSSHLYTPISLLSFLWTTSSWVPFESPPVAQLLKDLPTPEGSSSCSQDPSTGPYPEPHQSSPYHPHLISLKIHLNIILLPTSISP
jgi:hypothetical protein